MQLTKAIQSRDCSSPAATDPVRPPSSCACQYGHPAVILMKKSRYARAIWIHDLQLVYAYHRSDNSSRGRDCGTARRRRAKTRTCPTAAPRLKKRFARPAAIAPIATPLSPAAVDSVLRSGARLSQESRVAVLLRALPRIPPSAARSIIFQILFDFFAPPPYIHATKSCPPPSERVLRHKDFSHGTEHHQTNKQIMLIMLMV